MQDPKQLYNHSLQKNSAAYSAIAMYVSNKTEVFTSALPAKEEELCEGNDLILIRKRKSIAQLSTTNYQSGGDLIFLSLILD